MEPVGFSPRGSNARSRPDAEGHTRSVFVSFLWIEPEKRQALLRASSAYRGLRGFLASSKKERGLKKLADGGAPEQYVCAAGALLVPLLPRAVAAALKTLSDGLPEGATSDATAVAIVEWKAALPVDKNYTMYKVVKSARCSRRWLPCASASPAARVLLQSLLAACSRAAAENSAPSAPGSHDGRW